ncbi:MAG: phospholipid carrier-dependent glycosyltransferase [Methanophagales archaeon ANME-1-THS]|nr:MAG: phospholipid carrier-dependent glycosyltransferase [Methanophagales archaeon ANME-1-THS]
MSNKRDIPIIFGLFFVAFLIRVVNLSKVCLTQDEYIYWNNVNRIIANNFVPTAVVFEYASPFSQYIGAVTTLLIEGRIEVLRMISVLFGSLTVPLLYLFGKVIYDQKTGIIAALLLCFSAYHCLFSRIFMLEAFTLFFITAFLYFFWLSRCFENRKSTIYAICAGAMLGLAFDAKYISVFLIPAVLAYVLWTSGFNFKALLDKRIILIFIFAFLFVSPLLISWYYTGLGLDPMFYYLEKMSTKVATGTQVSSLSLDYLVVEGGKALDSVLAWGAEFLIPPWATLFMFSAFLLFIITFLSYLPNLLRKEKRCSILLISVSTLYVFYVVICATYTHYLIYSFPFYFVMLSHLAVTSFELLRGENNFKNIFRIFILLLVAIMLFSSFITGCTSSQWDEGDHSWVKSGMEYIKNDVSRSGYKKQIVIGTVQFTNQNLDYYADLTDLNATTYSLLGIGTNQSQRELESTCLKKIDLIKPDYIIMPIHKTSFYTRYFKGGLKVAILEDYSIVFRSQSYPYPCIVLKRNNITESELQLPTGNGWGRICQDVFNRSVPTVMKVGKVYTALVQIKNTGDSRADFAVRVYSDRFTLFVDEGLRGITLNEGSMCTLKFKIVPIREYREELPVTVDLFVGYDENERFGKKVDSFTDYVQLIER